MKFTRKFFIIIFLLLFLFALTSCAEKTFSISKKSFDFIFDASAKNFIASENGEYFLCETYSGKRISRGFQKLEYISNFCGNFLLAYDNGELSVMDYKGEKIIEKSQDMTIINADIIINKEYSEEKNLLVKPKAILINFIGEYGFLGNALYNLSGDIILVNPLGTIEIRYLTATDGNSKVSYFIHKVYEWNGEIKEISVLDDNFNNVYNKKFNKSINFISAEFNSAEFGYAVYDVKEFNENGEEISSKRNYDIISNRHTYEGFISLSSIPDEHGVTGGYLVGNNEDKYSIYSSNGIIKDLSQKAIVEKGNIKVYTDNSNLFDIYRYNGNLLLNSVSVKGNNYLKGNDFDTICYSLSGAELFSYKANEIKSFTSTRLTNNSLTAEIIKFTDYSDNNYYKFFLDDLFKKEYRNEYYYLNQNNGIYTFYTKNDVGEPDRYFLYNAYMGQEFSYEEGKAKNGSIYLYDYYTLENSHNIFFYNNLSAVLTPYSGDGIPGYAYKHGYYLFTYRQYKDFTIICIEFDTYDREKIKNSMPAAYKYINKNQRAYAYYIVKGKGKNAETELVYQGYNKMNFNYLEKYRLLIFSTIDYFNGGIYPSFDKLSDKTIIIKVENDDGNNLFIRKADIPVSNVSLYNEEYLIGVDYKKESKNFICSLSGEIVLEAKYYVNEIRGNLALVTNSKLGINGSFGIYDFKTQKLIEDCNNNSIVLLGANFYVITYNKINGKEYVVKDVFGKKIKIRDIKLVRIVYDYENRKTLYYYAINTGNNKIKMLCLKEVIIM